MAYMSRGKQTVAVALYRKYRSKSLDEVVGQKHVTDILASALKQGKIAHAYLLTGPRGVGKTSIARILAHEINQLPYDEESTHLDIIEIDAASNNGVDDVRDLREKATIAPVSARKKIYIIDEVHMLSKPAFNALLKTLEEPPEHVVFILATTDIDKLPATIISRTQRFGFRAINPEDAAAHLRKIADAEKIAIDDDALALIANRGDGSFRDSISLLDQIAGLGKGTDSITRRDVEMTLGLAPSDSIDAILAALDAHDPAAVISSLTAAEQEGYDGVMIASQLIRTIHESIAEHPERLPLLDELLDVARSLRPNVKLLTVLAGFAVPKQSPKSAALEAATPSISMSLDKLSQAAYKEKPVITAKDTPKPARPVEPKKPAPVASSPFDWEALIEYTRANHVALYSVLSKCSYELHGTDLVLYTGNNFYKKKIDDAKYHSLLYDSIAAIGAGELSVETIPTAMPPKNPQTAAVAAIMGGGEEVSVDSHGS